VESNALKLFFVLGMEEILLLEKMRQYTPDEVLLHLLTIIPCWYAQNVEIPILALEKLQEELFGLRSHSAFIGESDYPKV